MEYITIPGTSLKVSRIVLGCMQMGGDWERRPLTTEDDKRADLMTDAALESGINLFDHADFYSRYKSDEVFGRLLKRRPSLRDSILIQSKCGIRPPWDDDSGKIGIYDLSYEHIINSVDNILGSLSTDRLDFLLLHRPDPLVDTEEVAKAFTQLHTSGKVLHFGVSNHTAMQIDLLKKHVRFPLVANQLRFNILFSSLINGGVDFQISKSGDPMPSTMTWDYCRLNNIVIQAYGPQQHGYLVDRGEAYDLPESAFNSQLLNIQQIVTRIANEKACSKEAISLAWLLKIPHLVQPVIGTTNPHRIKKSCEACKVMLTREEWYELYVAGRGEQIP